MTFRETFDAISFLHDNKTKLVVNGKYLLEFRCGPFGNGFMMSSFQKESHCNRYFSYSPVNIYDLRYLDDKPLLGELYLDKDQDLVDDLGLAKKSMSLVFKDEFGDNTTYIATITSCEFYNAN